MPCAPRRGGPFRCHRLPRAAAVLRALPGRVSPPNCRTAGADDALGPVPPSGREVLAAGRGARRAGSSRRCTRWRRTTFSLSDFPWSSWTNPTPWISMERQTRQSPLLDNKYRNVSHKKYRSHHSRCTPPYSVRALGGGDALEYLLLKVKFPIRKVIGAKKFGRAPISGWLTSESSFE